VAYGELFLLAEVNVFGGVCYVNGWAKVPNVNCAIKLLSILQKAFMFVCKSCIVFFPANAVFFCPLF